jgi:hypothetical protein
MTLKNILVATDSGIDADAAVSYALAPAKQTLASVCAPDGRRRRSSNSPARAVAI